MGSLHLHVMAWVHNLCTFSGCLIEKNNKGINMTQMSSVLAVASVFIGFLATFTVSLREGGLYMRQNYLCMNLQ